MNVVVQRSNERGQSQTGGLNTFYSFSFGEYKNPDRAGFGILRAFNDSFLGEGDTQEIIYKENMDVIMLPLKGSVHWKDSLGHESLLRWGQLVVTSCGVSQVKNSMFDKSMHHPMEFIEIWTEPIDKNTASQSMVYDFRKALVEDRISTIVSPMDDAPAIIGQDVWVSVAECSHGIEDTYHQKRPNTGIFLYVLGGEISFREYELGPGDSAEITEASAIEVMSVKNSAILIIEVPMRSK